MGNWNPKYFEKKSGSLEEAILNAVNGVKSQIQEAKMDAVGKEDGDIDNDGDKDSSDKYLLKRRKAIGKAMKSESPYNDLQRARALAKKDGLDYDKLPKYDRRHDKHQEYYDDKVKNESVNVNEATPGTPDYQKYINMLKQKNRDLIANDGSPADSDELEARIAKAEKIHKSKSGTFGDFDKMKDMTGIKTPGTPDYQKYINMLKQKNRDIINDPAGGSPAESDALEARIAKAEKKHREASRSDTKRESYGMNEATGKDIAKKMMGSKTMKGFASKVAKMKSVTKGDLENMLPDYVNGADISKLFEAQDGGDFTTHMMYDPKTGKGYEAHSMADHLRMKKMGYDHKKPKMEAYEMGTKEYADHTRKVTPGQFESQGESDWNETVSLIQKKQTSMREALAKVWGYNEGKSPFEPEDNVKTKKNGKTMTGKPATKVTIDPDIKEKGN